MNSEVVLQLRAWQELEENPEFKAMINDMKEMSECADKLTKELHPVHGAIELAKAQECWRICDYFATFVERTIQTLNEL